MQNDSSYEDEWDSSSNGSQEDLLLAADGLANPTLPYHGTETPQHAQTSKKSSDCFHETTSFCSGQCAELRVKLADLQIVSTTSHIAENNFTPSHNRKILQESRCPELKTILLDCNGSYTQQQQQQQRVYPAQGSRDSRGHSSVSRSPISSTWTWVHHISLTHTLFIPTLSLVSRQDSYSSQFCYFRSMIESVVSSLVKPQYHLDSPVQTNSQGLRSPISPRHSPTKRVSGAIKFLHMVNPGKLASISSLSHLSNVNDTPALLILQDFVNVDLAMYLIHLHLCSLFKLKLEKGDKTTKTIFRAVDVGFELAHVQALIRPVDFPLHSSTTQRCQAGIKFDIETMDLHSDFDCLTDISLSSSRSQLAPPSPTSFGSQSISPPSLTPSAKDDEDPTETLDEREWPTLSSPVASSPSRTGVVAR